MPTAVARRAAQSAARLDRTDKRDALLRAAIDTFAARGFFNAQVADVARAAGVAAGTVYLYFRGKDDLLISIFERTMKEAIADGRQSVAALDRPRRAAAGDRRLASRPARPRPRPGRGLSGRAAAVDEVHGALLGDAAPRVPRHHPRRHRRRTGARGRSVPTISPTLAAKLFFGALDEMATNWILSRRKYSLVAEADAIVDLFVGGVAVTPSA